MITANLTTDGWTGITTSKGFPQDYKGKAPFIGVEALELTPKKLEIGSKTHLKYFTVKIRIIAKNDGQRLDLSDWLFEKLEDDINYYVYTITNGAVSAKVLTGRIVITRWNENRKELQNTENLESEDRYRQVFVFECIVAL
jgi:hypothetical protein